MKITIRDKIAGKVHRMTFTVTLTPEQVFELVETLAGYPKGFIQSQLDEENARKAKEAA